jgi:hypothetical protein
MVVVDANTTHFYGALKGSRKATDKGMIQVAL